MQAPRAVAWGAAALVVIGVAAFAARLSREGAQCDEGFVASGARCTIAAGACPAPLARAASGACEAPEVRVRIAPAKLVVGPSDWEAEGRVAPRTIETAELWIDAFEVTVARWAPGASDGARAASGMTRDEAAAFCAAHGGRLPAEDEWVAAAAAPRITAPRYPWGETGAVCRRAAWGLESGPCTHGANGPDTVGAHPSGDTPLGVHDLAGNVAEWVTTTGDADIARGGSYRSALATELRTWERLELPRGARSDAVGFRCAYDAPR